MDKKDIDELNALMPILSAFVDLLEIKRELQAQLEPPNPLKNTKTTYLALNCSN